MKAYKLDIKKNSYSSLETLIIIHMILCDLEDFGARKLSDTFLNDFTRLSLGKLKQDFGRIIEHIRKLSN